MKIETWDAKKKVERLGKSYQPKNGVVKKMTTAKKGLIQCLEYYYDLVTEILYETVDYCLYYNNRLGIKKIFSLPMEHL